MITIVDDVTLIIEDLNSTDYKVHATLSDDEVDTYVIDVFNLDKNAPLEKRSYSYFCDSEGGLIEDGWIYNDDVASAIHDELMTVIKGF